MSPLDRKLLRDLWRMKGQAAALGLVIAMGSMLIVTMSGLVTSLDETRRAYYERYRLAEVFAPAIRAPDRLKADLAAIPGVSAVELRVTGSALIDLEGQDLPVRAQAVSLPDFTAPRLNDIVLTAGRRPDPSRSEEIVLLRSFAQALGLRPGETLSATMHGARRRFRIVGLAQAPEFLYTTAPGELVPDDRRFGVIWMSRSALEAAYDMDGAFNEALLGLGGSGDLAAVLNAADRILGPYGGLGAYGVEDHVSNRFISEEIAGLRASSRSVPPLFMAVASFLLSIVVTRMVQSEREQIGLMKAFGYTDLEVCAHYFKLVLAIAAGGAGAGCLLGVLAGRSMVVLYQEYYKFPFLVFRLRASSFATGMLVSVLTAAAGGLLALRSVFALTPAVAMRPAAPPDYSRAGRIGRSFLGRLDQPSRMVLRRLTRQPWRMLGATIGIAAGMALSSAMLSLLAGFERTLALSFGVIDRSDVSVSFIEAISAKALFELERLPGVIEVEPVRIVPVVFRNGLRTHRGAVNGLVDRARLNRAVDRDMGTIALRGDGIILAEPLAKILDVHPGSKLTVAVREGRRPRVEVTVAGVASTLLGAPAFMRLDALNRALREPNRVSGAYLRIDGARRGAIYRALKGMPGVAGVSVKEDARRAFQTMMDSGAGAIRYVMVAIAGIITFGIIYNAARIAYMERTRDLATLAVMGFSRGETGFVLLGELAVVTLAALPLGSLLGHGLSYAVATGFSTDLYQVPVAFTPRSHGTAALAVLAAAITSGWLVLRDLARADVLAVLKTRE